MSRLVIWLTAAALAVGCGRDSRPPAAGTADAGRPASSADAAKPSAPASSCRRGEMTPAAGTLRQAWRAPLGAGDDWTVVASTEVVAARTETTVVGVDPATGTIRFQIDAELGFALAVGAGQVVFATMKEAARVSPDRVRYQGDLIAVDATTGKESWRRSITPHVDSLLATAGVLYFSAAETASPLQRAYAIDAATGTPRWDVELPAEAELVAVADGRGFVVGDGVVIALDLATGARLWEQPVELVDASDGLAVAGDRVHVGFPWRFETRAAADGALVWTAKGEGHANGRTRMHGHGDRGAVVFTRVFVHSDPPSPGPGDVGTVMLGFAAPGEQVFEHQVRIGDGDSDRRIARGVGFDGDRIVAAVEDRLQVFSLCELTVEEVALPARFLSGLAAGDGAIYVVVEGGALLRVD